MLMTPDIYTGVYQWDPEERHWTVWWIELSIGTNRNPQPDLINAERVARRLLMDQEHVLATRIMERGFSFRAFIYQLTNSPKHHNAMTINPWMELIDKPGEKRAVVQYALPHVTKDIVIRHHLQDYHTIKRLLLQEVADPSLVAKMVGHPVEDIRAAIDLSR